MTTDKREYGDGDATYQAAGQLPGLTQLCDRFYQIMDTLPEAASLRAMHPADLTESSRKLAFFLSGWTGGPKLYREHYGPISIPQAHAHLPADLHSTRAWLTCMDQALQQLDYPDDFREYLIRELSRPAQRVLQVCQHRMANR